MVRNSEQLMAEQVFINDVGPRDGLQNQAKILTPDQRLQLVTALVDAGLSAIEVGSFVLPSAVPAMAGTDKVIEGLPGGIGSTDVYYSVLVPNQKGFQLAQASGARCIEMVVASTETMNTENIRRTTEQAMAACEQMIKLSNNESIDSLACISTAWECPFEGLVDSDVVIKMTDQMFEWGATRVIIADTIGAAGPDAVHDLMSSLVDRFGAGNLACHFHDTRGMGVANTYAAVSAGIRHFDASVGGLGGCPFAPGATGNVATEDVALMLSQAGFKTGIDLKKLVAAADLAGELTGSPTGGHSSRWLKRQIDKGAL